MILTDAHTQIQIWLSILQILIVIDSIQLMKNTEIFDSIWLLL